MKVRLLAGGAIVGLLVVLLAPMTALAQAITTTTHFSGTRTLSDVNPCTGVPGTLAETFRAVTHTTELPNGFHATTTFTERFTFVPDDPSEPGFAGKAGFSDAENLNRQNRFSRTFTAHTTARGADGSRITEHVVAHVTVDPAGIATVEFERARLRCS